MDYIAEYFKLKLNPAPYKEACVLCPNVRFTVLTDRIIRLEYSQNNTFEDRATMTFWHRKQEVPEFRIIRSGNTTEIITKYLDLKYHESYGKFTSESLSITLLSSGKVWHFGDNDTGNLLGTIRTLDGVNGKVPLGKGLLSRNGWTIVDDSNTPVINNECWFEERNKNGIDYYFFGYGNEYIRCIQDFCRLSGNVSMIPRWVLGNWWSRYWEYSSHELLSLMKEFKDNGIPLSVCIVDMDWHLVKNEYSTGWTGYTWNRELFPEPEEFLKCLHKFGLKTALNLHPAEGICPHEEMYEEMANFMGIDPETRKTIEFNITDPKFTSGYFNILHHPLEKQGVDFWWLDWQQGEKTRFSNLDPLPILNHLHYNDLGRDKFKRPFIFSRYGGYGSHRYPIGFSGDTVVSWETLSFQPYFTSTASNVAYGWWSHDIGGHMCGTENSELYARWVQFGILSPVLRIHSTKNPFQDRRPWTLDRETFNVIRDAMVLRHRLIPYIYSFAWRNYKDGIPLIEPMYYNHPSCEEAYNFTNQYYFGSELIASPYTSPMDKDTNLSRQPVWLPEGGWFDFFTGEYYPGNSCITKYGTLRDIPLFARCGAIIPMDGKVEFGNTGNPESLDIYIFPGAGNEFVLYEDDGVSQEYINGKHHFIRICQTWSGNHMEVTINGEGEKLDCIPDERKYNLKIRGLNAPDIVELYLNEKKIPGGFKYDSSNVTLNLSPLKVSSDDKVMLRISSAENLLSTKSMAYENCMRLLRTFTAESKLKYEVMKNLNKIMEDTTILNRYYPELKTSQLLALVETIRQCSLQQ